VLTLAIEPMVLARAKRRGRAIAGYERRDAIASVSLGAVSLVFVGLINLGIYAVAERLWAHRVVDLGHGVLGWTVATLGWDFSYYWYHRVEHETRLLWACHVNHHSSRYYNLSTALRQPWTPIAGLLFYPVWALLGVDPKHAQITVSMAGFTLVDLGSKHGTRVNAEKVRERPLSNEDVIQIGAARFVFREG